MVQRGPPNGRRRALAFELSPPAVSYRSLGGRRVPQQAGLSPLRPSPIHGGSGAPSPGAAWTNLLSAYVHRPHYGAGQMTVRPSCRRETRDATRRESATSRVHSTRAPRQPTADLPVRRPEALLLGPDRRRATPPHTAEEGAEPGPRPPEGRPPAGLRSGGVQPTAQGKQRTRRIGRPRNDPYGLPFTSQGRDFRLRAGTAG